MNYEHAYVLYLYDDSSFAFDSSLLRDSLKVKGRWRIVNNQLLLHYDSSICDSAIVKLRYDPKERVLQVINLKIISNNDTIKVTDFKVLCVSNDLYYYSASNKCNYLVSGMELYSYIHGREKRFKIDFGYVLDKVLSPHEKSIDYISSDYVCIKYLSVFADKFSKFYILSKGRLLCPYSRKIDCYFGKFLLRKRAEYFIFVRKLQNRKQ